MKLPYRVITVVIAVTMLGGWLYVSQRHEAGSSPPLPFLTKEALAAVADTDLEQTVFDSIDAVIGTKNEFQAVQALSPGQQAFFTTWVVEGEVNNGGFNQFYYNSSRQYATLAVDGFNAFGAVKFAELMQRANTVYDSIRGQLDAANDRTLEGFSASYENNPLNELDGQFYDLYQEENLSELRIKYVRSHLGEFTQE